MTLSGLCALAGVQRSLLNKWKHERHSPTIRKFDSEMAKIDGALVARELALRDYLLRLHPLPGPNSQARDGGGPSAPVEGAGSPSSPQVSSADGEAGADPAAPAFQSSDQTPSEVSPSPLPLSRQRERDLAPDTCPPAPDLEAAE